MSTWIYVKNLPFYYDEFALQEFFGGIVQSQNIIAASVSKDNLIMKSSGFVQFSNPKDAKLAASKKDQSVISNSAIRVYLVWHPKEDLSTVKVTNIPNQCTAFDLQNAFDNYGGIVDIQMLKCDSPTALISFCRVDYALQAVQEMNGSIIGIGRALCVELANPDARV